MMNLGNVPRAIHYKLFGKTAKTATNLDSLVLVKIDRANNFCVKYYVDLIPNWVKHM